MLDAARGGDARALDRLFALHRGRLVAWLAVSTRTSLALRASHEDLAHEVLLEATRQLARFEERGPSSFYSWLIGIARFKLAEASRAARAAKRACVEPLERDPTGYETSPTQAAVRSDRAHSVRTALGLLAPLHADVLRLRYLEGRSTAETARALHKSEVAVKALVTRAFAELAAHLRANFEESAPPRAGEAPSVGTETPR